MKPIIFEEQEIKVLTDLMDAGIKQYGLSHTMGAAMILQKLQNAKEVEPMPPSKKSE
jgi:hypothetical protein